MAAPAGRTGFLERVWLVARTIGIAGIGGAAFQLLALPAAWISGGMTAVAVAAVSGLAVSIPPLLGEVVFFILGITIGSAITPESIAGIGLWPLSAFILCLTTPAVMIGAGSVLVRLRGWRRDDALLATAPGGLSLVLIVAESIGANVPRIAIAQVLRLAILVVLLPPLILLFVDLPPASMNGGMAQPVDPVDLALLVVAALAGVGLAMLARLPAPTLLGAMVGSGALYGSGIAQSPIPDGILIPGLVVVGAFIGARFKGMTLADLKADSLDAVIGFAASFAISAAMAGLVTILLGISFGQTLLAFAPGGFEVMTVLAFSLGLDAAYVALHQTMRFIVIAIVTPLVFRKRRTE